MVLRNGTIVRVRFFSYDERVNQRRAREAVAKALKAAYARPLHLKLAFINYFIVVVRNGFSRNARKAHVACVCRPERPDRLTTLTQYASKFLL